MTATTTQTPPADQWSEWLLQIRHGRSADFRAKLTKVVDAIRDRVLDAASLKPGTTLLDVGTGDGLVALGAIQRVGPSLRVVMTDASEALLSHTRDTARERGVESQCTFLHGNAERLEGIADASVDVVTTRAVLAYVANKRAALAEIFRVLRPGGRLSLADPIFQDEAFEATALTRMLQTQPSKPDFDFLRLVQRWKAAQYPTTEAAMAANPLTNCSERDLVRLAAGVGFTAIHMELHIDLTQSWITDWEVFLDGSPHPLAKPLRQIFAEQFSPAERLLFERVMRPQVESGHTITSNVIAYLAADKPEKH